MENQNVYLKPVVLAFSRSFVFMLITMIVLPAVFGVNGIWLATPASGHFCSFAEINLIFTLIYITYKHFRIGCQ